MEVSRAIQMIQPGVPQEKGSWADLGAGDGTFTLALQQLLPSGSTIHALDKSPHLLWRLEQKEGIKLVIHDADFTREMDLEALDGIIMANSLHYVKDHARTLEHILSYLNPKHPFIFIEYETIRPIPTWVPYPIPFVQFERVAAEVGLTDIKKIAEVPSRYGYEHIYAAVGIKKE